nr:zinc finger, CCHC-type [Tanacetum cinerariifolium]
MSEKDDKKIEVGTSKIKEIRTTTHFQCPMLKGANYTTWAIRMQVILESIGLWEMIEPKLTTEADTKKDKTTIAYIYQSLPEEQLLLISKYKTAKEVWDALKKRHVGENRVQQAKQQTLKSEFEMLQMEENESIDSFVTRLTGIINKAASVGLAYEDSTLVRKLLNAVPDRFLQIVASIEQYSDLDTMSLDEAIGRLKTFEERLKYKNERPVNTQERLLFAQHEDQGPQFRRRSHVSNIKQQGVGSENLDGGVTESMSRPGIKEDIYAARTPMGRQSIGSITNQKHDQSGFMIDHNNKVEVTESNDQPGLKEDQNTSSKHGSMGYPLDHHYRQFPASRRILEDRYKELHGLASYPQEIKFSYEDLKHIVKKYWMMAETGNRQFAIACSEVASAFRFVCSLLFLDSLAPLFYFDYPTEDSDYNWSLKIIVPIQLIGVIIADNHSEGLIASMREGLQIVRNIEECLNADSDLVKTRRAARRVWTQVEVYRVSIGPKPDRTGPAKTGPDRDRFGLKRRTEDRTEMVRSGPGWSGPDIGKWHALPKSEIPNAAPLNQSQLAFPSPNESVIMCYAKKSTIVISRSFKTKPSTTLVRYVAWQLLKHNLVGLVLTTLLVSFVVFPSFE